MVPRYDLPRVYSVHLLGNCHYIQVKTLHYGRGENGSKSPVTEDWEYGPKTLSYEEMKSNRSAFGHDILAQPLDDAHHRERSPQ